MVNLPKARQKSIAIVLSFLLAVAFVPHNVFAEQNQPVASENQALLAQISQALQTIRAKIVAIAAALDDLTTEPAAPVSTPQPTPTITPPPPLPQPAPAPAYTLPAATPASTPIQAPTPTTITPTILRPPTRIEPTNQALVDQINLLQERVRGLQRQIADAQRRTTPTSATAPQPFSTQTLLSPQSPQTVNQLVTPRLGQPQTQEPEFVKGSLLVQFRPGFTPESVRNKVSEQVRFVQSKLLFLARHQTNALLRDTYELKISETADVRLAAAEYQNLVAEVKSAGPNFIARTQQVPVQSVSIAPIAPSPPNDPLYSQQWHLPKVSAEAAWSIETGNPNTVIAVIDTGVKWNHPDLAANIWTNTGEIPNNNIDDDNNGFIDDVRGWDFVETTLPCWPGEDCLTEDNNPDDFHGHGTHVSGIAAAVTNNGIGVAGVCWTCKIMPVRAGFAYQPSPTVPEPSGALEYDDIAQALIYAADNGADIISMSFVGSDSFIMQSSINYAYNQGKVLVAASGNSNSDNTISAYPAAYSNVIAVAASDQTDLNAYFTNYGSWVDVAAPGVAILATVIPGVTWACSDTSLPPNNDGFGLCSGTSMAAPLLSGVVGLALSKIPTLTQNQALTLVQTAKDPLNISLYIGTGRTNAFKAVQPVTVPLALLDNSLNNLFATSTIAITGTAAGQNFLKYKVEFGGPATYPTSWTTIQGDVFVPVTNSLLATWNPASLGLPTGMYTIRLLVTDVNQKLWEDRALVIFDPTITPGWPKKIPEHVVSSPALVDVDADGNGEMFFQANSNPPVQTKFYALDHTGLPLPGWPITMSGSYGLTHQLSPAVADIDNDPNFEIVYGATDYPSWLSQYFVYEPNAVSQTGWPVTIATTSTAAIMWSSPVISNLDGGPDLEIIVITENYSPLCGPSAKVYAYKQNGQLLPGWPQQLPCRPRGTAAVGDIDANGDLEIIISTTPSGAANGYLYVFNHDGTLFPGWPQQVTYVYSPVIADIDQNDGGKLEIIQGGWNGNLYVLNHDGTPVPGWPQLVYPYSYSPAIGDIDGNGDLEIAFGTYNNSIVVLNHDGTPFQGWPVLTGIVIDGSPILVDIDGNGTMEIIISSGGRLFGFYQNGAPIRNFPKFMISTSYSSPAAGDFNGNGLIDLFVIDYEGNMYFWEFTGLAISSALQWPMFHHDPQHTGKYP